MSTQTQPASQHTGQKRILFPILQNNHIGYIDKTGEVILQPQYDGVSSDRFRVAETIAVRGFREGLAPVQAGQDWGYMDHNGKMVIDPDYEEAGLFQNGLAPVKISGKW